MPSTTPTFHALVWAGWAVAAAASVQIASSPSYSVIVLAITTTVVEAHRREGALVGAYGIVVTVSMAFAALRVVLTALTTHSGAGPVIVELPEGTLPALLGGFTVGGEVEGLVVARSAAEGLTLVAIVAAFAGFNAVASHHELLAAAPRALYELGLAVSVALTFVPATLEAIGTVRDSDRARTGGAVKRRGRLLRQIVPVLEIGLERAVHLAESMDARGFGRSGAVGRRAGAVACGLAGTGALGVAFVALVAGEAMFGLAAVGAGGVGLVAATVWASRASRRTRYRVTEISRRGWGTLAMAVATPLLLIVVATLRGPLTWPGPGDLALPSVELLAVAALAPLAGPLLHRGTASARVDL